MQKAFHSTDLKDWEKAIIAEFPLVYRETDQECKAAYLRGNLDAAFDDAAPPEDYCNLRYGFECGAGWETIIREFSKVATETVVAARATDPNAFIHSCIFKEKLGRLAWQGNWQLPAPLNTLFASYAMRLASISTGTCEKTGKYGEMHECEDGGYVRTLSIEEGKKAGMRPVRQDRESWTRTRPEKPGWYWFYKPGKKSKPEKNIGVMRVDPKSPSDPKIIYGPEARKPYTEMLRLLINKPKGTSEKLALKTAAIFYITPDGGVAFKQNAKTPRQKRAGEGK